MSCYFCGRGQEEVNTMTPVEINDYITVLVCNLCKVAILTDACRRKFKEEYEARPKLADEEPRGRGPAD